VTRIPPPSRAISTVFGVHRSLLVWACLAILPRKREVRITALKHSHRFPSVVQMFNTTNNFTYPDTATAVCNPGYVIANPKFNCSTSGIYCCGPFECTGRLCTRIPNSTTYSYAFSPSSLVNETYFPINISYACALNYFTRNATVGQCTTSGGWSIAPPICVRFAIDEM